MSSTSLIFFFVVLNLLLILSTVPADADTTVLLSKVEVRVGFLILTLNS